MTLFVNAQDKVGHGSDSEGCDSAGVGTVTTWVKPIVIPENCCECSTYYFAGEVNNIFCTSLSKAKLAINAYRTDYWGGSGANRKLYSYPPSIGDYVYNVLSPCSRIIITSSGLPTYYILNLSTVVGTSIIIHQNSTTKQIDYIEYY